MQLSCERSLSLEIIAPRNKWILAYLKTFLRVYGDKERTAEGSLLLLFLNEVSQVLCLVGRHSLTFQVCLGELDSCPSPCAVLQAPGFECEPLSASVMSLWIPTRAVCVRMCKTKHGDAPLAAQSRLMEQG